MLKARFFTPYIFGSTAGDRTPDLLTTRSTFYPLGHGSLAHQLDYRQLENEVLKYIMK